MSTSTASAASASASAFSYPPPFGKVGEYASDLNFTVGSNVDIRWSGAPSTATLWLFRDIQGITCTEWNLASTYCTRLLPSFQNQNDYTWTVQTYASSYDNTPEPYYFVMGPEPPRVSGISAFDSHYFNIVPSSGASSSSSASATPTSTSVNGVVTAGASASTRSSTASSASSASSAGSSSATTSRSSATSAGAGATSSGSSTSRASSSMTSVVSSSSASASATALPATTNTGLSTGTKAAIGVAIGVGIPLIALLAYIAFVLSRKRSKKNNAVEAAASPHPSKTTAAYQGYPELSDGATKKPEYSELGGGATMAKDSYPRYSQNPAMSELPGHQYQQPTPQHYELPGEEIRR